MIETLPKLGDQLIGRSVGCRRQCNGVIQYRLLKFIECIAVPVDRQIRDLFFRYAMFSADGRADVQSEYTPDHR